MLKKSIIISILAPLIISGFLLFPGLVLAGNCTGYAWGENVGWINFNPSQGSGVTVTDSAVTGYAWGENIGWINLNPTNGGVTNDGNGNLSGYAWGENVGWINFNPTYEGVTIDSSTGNFSGYAWGENIGWINFNPTYGGVETSWTVAVEVVAPLVGGTAVPSTPVSATGQGNISQNLGGQISQTFESGKIAKVVFPSGSIKGTIVTKIEPQDKVEIIKTNPLPRNNQIVGDLVADFKALSSGKEIESFEKEIPITFIYSDKQVKEAGLDEKTLKIYFWNKETNKWKPLESKVNTFTNTVTAQTTHFTLFTLMGESITEKPITEMTIEEIQAKIVEIQAEIAVLEAQLTELLTKPAVTEIPSDYQFITNLKYDQTSDDVRYLQIFLKAQGTNIYPEGIISGWFGPLTKKAVIKFQEKYSEDILSLWELSEGTGYVGRTTRDKINEILGR